MESPPSGLVSSRRRHAWDSVDTASGQQTIQGVLFDGWSAVANAGPATYFAVALPSCGGLTLTMGGFPAVGSTITATLSGYQGTPYLLLGLSIPPIEFCPGCLLGVEPNTAIILQTDTFVATVPCLGELVNNLFAIQGVDIGSAAGCSGGVTFSLSEEVIVVIL